MATLVRRSQSDQSSRVFDGNRAADAITLSASDLWKNKREFQRMDIEGLESGRLTFDDVAWFAGGVTRNAKLDGTLF